MSRLNGDAQPINRRFNVNRIKDRTTDELLGLCKGIIADSKVDQSEAEFLLNWINNNPASLLAWPGNAIAERLSRHLDDNHLDADEAADLLSLLQDITGEKYQAMVPANMSSSCFDDPQPPVTFSGKTFCLTGKFAMGQRKACEQEVLDLGGKTIKNPSGKTDYLVIGSIGSTDWIHTSFGRKIEKAKELQADGATIAIISEDHWAAHL